MTSARRRPTGDSAARSHHIDIQTGGSDGVGSTNATATIDPNTVITALGSSNVTLEASHDITVNSDVIYSSTNALTLLAQQDITVSANIQNSSTGAINVLAGWDGTTTDLGQLTTNPGASGNNSGSVTVAGLGIAVGSGGRHHDLPVTIFSLQHLHHGICADRLPRRRRRQYRRLCR